MVVVMVVQAMAGESHGTCIEISKQRPHQRPFVHGDDTAGQLDFLIELSS
jgi:hypothetical protein